MIVIGIPMILVENVIGRRLRVNSIDAFGDKIQDKGKNISKYWKIIGYMGLLGAFGIMAYYMVLGGWVMSYIISLINNTLDISAPITKEVAKDFYDLHIRQQPMGNHALHIPICGSELHYFSERYQSAGLNVPLNT